MARAEDSPRDLLKHPGHPGPPRTIGLDLPAQQVTSYAPYIKAGDDYANGSTTAGDAELQIANTMFAR